MNVGLPCKIRSAERVKTFVWKCANAVKRSLVMSVRFPCDLRSTEQVVTLASKLEKDVNRCFVSNITWHVIFDHVSESQFLIRSEENS